MPALQSARNFVPSLAILALPTLLAASAPPSPVAPASETRSSISGSIRWRDDSISARSEALTSGKPLLCVFHCQLKPTEAGLETRDNRPSDSAILRQAAQYVPLRISSLKSVDLETFRFDYDLQFAALVIDPRDGATLARWGTRDSESDSERISAAGLAFTLREAFAAYKHRTPSRQSHPAPQTLMDDPVFTTTARAREDCSHCHYAYDAEIARLRRNGIFTKARLFRYPLPETIGLTLDKDRGNRIVSVLPGSPAKRVGLQAGDTLTSVAGTAVYSSADLQYALDTVSDPGKVTVGYSRSGKPPTSTILSLPQGWRAREDISWRPSQGGVPPFLGTWEKPLSTDEKSCLGISPARLALRITTLFSGEKWAATHAGLSIGDVIIACDSETPPAVSTAGSVSVTTSATSPT